MTSIRMTPSIRGWLRRDHDISITKHAEARIEEMAVPLEAIVTLVTQPDLRYSSRGSGGDPGFIHQCDAWPQWALVVKYDGPRTVVVSVVFREGEDYVRTGSSYEVPR